MKSMAVFIATARKATRESAIKILDIVFIITSIASFGLSACILIISH